MRKPVRVWCCTLSTALLLLLGEPSRAHALCKPASSLTGFDVVIALDDLTLDPGTVDRLLDEPYSASEGEYHETYRELVGSTLCMLELGSKANGLDAVAALDVAKDTTSTSFYSKLALQAMVAILTNLSGSPELQVAGQIGSSLLSLATGVALLQKILLIGQHNIRETIQLYFEFRGDTAPDDLGSHYSAIAEASSDIEAACAAQFCGSHCDDCLNTTMPRYLQMLYSARYLYLHAQNVKGQLASLLQQGQLPALQIRKSSLSAPRNNSQGRVGMWIWQGIVKLGTSIADPATYWIQQGFDILLRQEGVPIYHGQLTGELLSLTSSANGSTALQYRDRAGSHDGVTSFKATSRDRSTWKIQFAATTPNLVSMGGTSLTTSISIGTVVADSEVAYGAKGNQLVFSSPCANGRPKTPYYKDADKDGFGDPHLPKVACTIPSGYSALGNDCDDTDPAIHPGVTEACQNGIDDNCDGLVDAADPHCVTGWSCCVGSILPDATACAVELTPDGVGLVGVSSVPAFRDSCVAAGGEWSVGRCQLPTCGPALGCCVSDENSSESGVVLPIAVGLFGDDSSLFEEACFRSSVFYDAFPDRSCGFLPVAWSSASCPDVTARTTTTTTSTTLPPCASWISFKEGDPAVPGDGRGLTDPVGGLDVRYYEPTAILGAPQDFTITVFPPPTGNDLQLLLAPPGYLAAIASGQVPDPCDSPVAVAIGHPPDGTTAVNGAIGAYWQVGVMCARLDQVTTAIQVNEADRLRMGCDLSVPHALVVAGMLPSSTPQLPAPIDGVTLCSGFGAYPR